jgi:hypothetical protein
MINFIRNHRMAIGALAAAGTAGIIFGIRQKSKQVPPDITPLGKPKSWETKVLKFGSKILQSNDPLKDTNVYLVGFHPRSIRLVIKWKPITTASK